KPDTRGVRGATTRRQATVPALVRVRTESVSRAGRYSGGYPPAGGVRHHARSWRPGRGFTRRFKSHHHVPPRDKGFYHVSIAPSHRETTDAPLSECATFSGLPPILAPRSSGNSMSDVSSA